MKPKRRLGVLSTTLWGGVEGMIDEKWHTDMPKKSGRYLAQVGQYQEVLHHRGEGRGWTYKQNERPPKVDAWRHLPPDYVPTTPPTTETK